MATIYIGQVVSVDDKDDGERIKVRILPTDRKKKDSELPYAFPLLPKMLHIKPKVGEAVCVICQNDDFPRTQRFYIGPIISQPQFMYKEDYISSTALLDGGVKDAEEAVSNMPDTNGAFPKKEDIAICGRKNGDIILSDNDVRIRCGAHLVDEHDSDKVTFNNGAPAYIKLKYFPEAIQQENIDHKTTKSVANIIGGKINLISAEGDPYVDICDTEEGISDEDIKNFIENAHQLPYGDALVDFLYLFIKMFKSHTHKYHNMPPCPDTDSETFDLKYGISKEKYENILLSKDIRIN